MLSNIPPAKHCVSANVTYPLSIWKRMSANSLSVTQLELYELYVTRYSLSVADVTILGEVSGSDP